MIEAERLTKDYGTVLAVEELSFRVGSGEVVGFLGPNGAGKSTTLRMLAGYLAPTRGRVTLLGFDMQREPLAARRRLGYLPEAAPLYPELKVREYLGFRAELKRVPRRERRTAVGRAMERARVTDVAETLILHLSKGYRQRVGLADALLASPPLLILDEPTAGLDPNQIREVRALLRELGQDHTILLSTHILSEVEAVCDRALVIDRGKLVAEGTIEALLAQGRTGSLVVVVRDPERRAEALARALAGVSGVVCTPGESAELSLLELSLDAPDRIGAVSDALSQALVEAKIGIRSINPGKTSLEQVFAALTAAASAPEPANADQTSETDAQKRSKRGEKTA
jgi:ABC-2 type transport system ATP-binding protein